MKFVAALRRATGHRLCAVSFVAALACLPVPVAAQEPAVVLVGGRVWTGDPARPWAEALAVRDGVVLVVGTRAEVVRAAGVGARIEEFPEAMLTPGFIDTHTHFLRAGELLLGVNLLDVADDGSLALRVREAHERLPAGSWMVGGDWGAYALESTWQPTRGVVEAITGDRPALLSKWDRSAYLANGAALRAAGLDPTTHSGLLTPDEAARVRRAIPPPPFSQRLAEARLALRDLASHGVTTIHDITGAEAMRLFQHLRDQDALTVRVCARPTLDHWTELANNGITIGFGDDRLKVCGLKGFVDGIMGNSSAMFREPYRHRPDTRGRWRAMMSPPGTMEAMIFGADSTGLTPHIHAIGDLAVDTLLDFYTALVSARGARDRRLRVIHAQVVEADDFARFGELGLVAEVQPYHAIDDLRWMEERIGARARGAYAFRSLAEAGAVLAFGSDWPGTNASWYPADPVLGIYAAVSRQTLDGEPEGGWYPEERVDVETALRAYTSGGAYAAFEEDRKGRLAPGFFADVVVLSADLTQVAPAAIKEVRVLGTMVGGRWTYRSP